MTPAWMDPIDLLDQYEALRTEALQADPMGRRGHGLALFMSRGMTAWISALSAFVGRSMPFAQVREHTPPMLMADLPSSVCSDLIAILADMVMALSEETMR